MRDGLRAPRRRRSTSTHVPGGNHMLRKLGPLAAALMLSASFAVGCGSDNNSSTSSGSGSSTGSSSSGSSSSGTSSGSSSSSGRSSTDAAVKAAQDQCRTSINSNSAVTSDIKSDLLKICDNITTDPNDIKKVAKEVCLKIVEKTVPSGSAQDQAKSACDQAGG